jgi:hypothetical protein
MDINQLLIRSFALMICWSDYYWSLYVAPDI